MPKGLIKKATNICMAINPAVDFKYKTKQTKRIKTNSCFFSCIFFQILACFEGELIK